MAAIFANPGEIFGAFPSTLNLVNSRGLAEYTGLRASYELPLDGLSVQLWALTAAKLLASQLRDSGANVYRQIFSAGLIETYQHQTNFGPTLTFLPNKKISAVGATIFKLNNNKEGDSFDPVWVEIRN